MVIIHFKASWYMSFVPSAARLQDYLILSGGYFFVQIPFSRITGMLPRLLNNKKLPNTAAEFE
ncbi:hypothetical protein ABE26_08200 [Cytobacillus firmus]|nr:hypothetical protein [Cytobacillus firmus]